MLLMIINLYIKHISICSSKILFEVLIGVINVLSTGGLINLSNYWIANTLKLLKFIFEVAFLSIGVGVEPVTGVGEGILDCALVIFGDIGEFIFIFNTVFHLINV